MYKDQRAVEIKVGIISVIAIALLIMGITLGRGLNVAGVKPSVVIRFANANGIEPTSPVWINGVKRGSVLSVTPDGNGVVVGVAVDDVSSFRKDVQASISMLEVTGGKKVDIDPGVSLEAWDSSKEIIGTASPDFVQLFKIAGDVGTDVQKLVKRLDTVTASLHVLLADGSLVSDVKRTADNARETTDVLRELVVANRERLQSAIDNIASISDNLRHIVNDDTGSVKSLLGKLDVTVSNADRLMLSADSTVNRINTIIDNVNSITKDVKSGKGTIGRLLYDEKLSSKLDSAIANLQVFIDQVSHHGINVNVRLGSRP